MSRVTLGFKTRKHNINPRATRFPRNGISFTGKPDFPFCALSLSFRKPQLRFSLCILLSVTTTPSPEQPSTPPVTGHAGTRSLWLFSVQGGKGWPDSFLEKKYFSVLLIAAFRVEVHPSDFYFLLDMEVFGGALTSTHFCLVSFSG